MGGDITPLGSTPGVWPTMLQATKRGASSLPLFSLTIKILLLLSAVGGVTVPQISREYALADI